MKNKLCILAALACLASCSSANSVASSRGSEELSSIDSAGSLATSLVDNTLVEASDALEETSISVQETSSTSKMEDIVTEVTSAVSGEESKPIESTQESLEESEWESLPDESIEETTESLMESKTLEESSEISSTEATSELLPEVLDDPLDEPYIGKQFYLNHMGDIYSAWDSYRGDGVTVAVIDAGFNPYHEDFYYKDGTSKVLPTSANFEERNGRTITEVGVEKVINMGDSHGTFCAGVLSAAINGKGVVGIAPNSDLMLLKTDKRPRSIEKAFRYAADNGAKVITISIGSYYNYEGDLIDDGSDLGTVFDSALAYCHNKGVVVCSAAGNGGLDNMPTEYTFPGACDYVIGAGGLAANSSSEIWEGSSYNSSPDYEFCDVFAPANDMFGCCHYDNKIYDGGWNGTSFASPIVAGLAALYFEKNPSKTPLEFQNDLYSTCVQIESDVTPKTNQLGHGRVDVGALLGVSRTGQIEVKLDANWSSANCYIWNSITGTQARSWPGQSMNKEGVYKITVDASLYDSVIFSSGNNQTIDIAISSFASGKTYSLINPSYEGSCLVGSYN